VLVYKGVKATQRYDLYMGQGYWLRELDTSRGVAFADIERASILRMRLACSIPIFIICRDPKPHTLDLYPSHKKELLSICIWKITQADGKYKVRYWSEGAVSAEKRKLQHEHVVERKELIQRLLAGEEVDLVVADAIACIVTEEEHALLGKSQASGWSRYRDAGIRVYDSMDGKWLS